MYLVELLLPLHDNDKKQLPSEHFRSVRDELTERFGGVTAFVRSPAVELWKEGTGDEDRDEMVMFEVIASELDKKWWAEYLIALEKRFRQEQFLVWASRITKL